MAAEDGKGTGLAARLAQMLGVVRDADGNRLVKPFVRRYDRYTSLQFSRKQTQSRMLTAEPDVLLIDYTRTMMAALLLRPDSRSIGMVGLGGGSQAKFCHRHLPRARIEVVENNPAVIALRRKFAIPDDDERLQVHLGDGAKFLQSRRGSYDLLLVDGYDEHGIPPALSTQQFYDDCRDALAPGGVMSVNLFSTGSAAHLELIGRSFGGRMVVLEETKMSNRVAFAWMDGALPPAPLDAGVVLRVLSEDARRQLGPAFARLAQALEDADAQ